MQLSARKTQRNVGINDKQTWRTWLKDKATATLKQVLSQKTP